MWKTTINYHFHSIMIQCTTRAKSLVLDLLKLNTGRENKHRCAHAYVWVVKRRCSQNGFRDKIHIYPWQLCFLILAFISMLCKYVVDNYSAYHDTFLAATKQLYEWSFPSVCLSVCLSHLFDYVPIIVSSWNFQELFPNDKSDVHAKGQGQRSKVMVTEVNTQLNRFRIVTPVWIHIWWWNDAYSLMMLRRGALLFLKVIRQISRSHGSKKRWIWPRLGVSGL